MDVLASSASTSVHQGDQDGLKGVYHINAVDCVTQWELVATCEKISEVYLLLVITALISSLCRVSGSGRPVATSQPIWR